MHIAGVKPVGDLAAYRIGRGEPSVHRPMAGQCPLIQGQPHRGGIEAAPAKDRAADRGKILRALVAEAVFLRSQVGPIGGCLDPLPIRRNQFIGDADRTGLGQEKLDDFLRLLV